MHKTFTFVKPSAIDSEENVLPLINVVFLLLIFFLLAGTIAIPDLFQVEPPDSISETSVTPTETTILIAADGRIAFQEDTLELNEISSVVKKIIDESPSQVFKIKADASANSGIVIDTLEILRDSGAKKTLLLTTKDN